MLGPDFNRVYTDKEIWPAEQVFNWSKLQNKWLKKLTRNQDIHGAAESAEFADEITSDVDESFDVNDNRQGAQCSNVNQKSKLSRNGSPSKPTSSTQCRIAIRSSVETEDEV